MHEQRGNLRNWAEVGFLLLRERTAEADGDRWGRGKGAWA